MLFVWRRQLVQRMLIGAVVLAIYGAWSTAARLPENLGPATWFSAMVWAIDLFALTGLLAGAGIA